MIDCDCVELFCRIPEATDVSSVTLKADVLFLADRIVFRKQTACWMYANNSKPTCLNRHLKFIWTFMKEPPSFLMLDLSDLQPPSAAGLIYQGDSFQSLNHHRLCGFLVFFLFNFFVVVALSSDTTVGLLLLQQKALLISICTDEEQRNRSGFIASLVLLVLIRRVL